MARPVGQTHEVQQFLGSFPRLRGRFSCDKRGNHHVLDGRKLRQELMKLEDEAHMAVAKFAELMPRQLLCLYPIDHHRPAIGLVQRADDLEERGLARPRGTHDAHHLPFVDVEVDAFEHL